MADKRLFKYAQFSQEVTTVKSEGPVKPQIAHYLLEEKLGSGGMGQVWKAIDTHLARPVALKVLPNTFLLDQEARAKFLREARVASVLNHPNIVTIFDTGEHEQQLFIAMELIDGLTVRELISRREISYERAIEIMKQTLMGLGAAHQANIIHRDIKPENLMIRKDGYVKILDFGLAKAMSPGELHASPTTGVVGTPRYMSPEQVKNDPVDERTDLFSLGAVFYELLSGSAPFSGENLPQLMASILSQNPPPLPGVAPELTKVVMRALQKEREKRYSSAGEFLGDIVAFAGGTIEIPVAMSETSMVILPFSCAAEEVVLADGIVDELIGHLGRMRKLRIIASSTSRFYRNHTMSVREIGRELNVNMALEGSLRRSGEKVRVLAQLVNTRDGFQMWNGRFDIKVKDIFDMEDEISAAIIEELNRHFASMESLDVPLPSPIIDSAASELYFRALSLQSTFRINDIKKSVELYRQVLELAPDFAIGHAKLSIALANLHRLLTPGAPPTLLTEAETHAQKAIKLDPSSPDAYVSLGIIAKNSGDFASAIMYLKRALKIAPNHASALSWLSYVRIFTGDPDAAEICARKAIERDPAGSIHYTFLGYSLLSMGRFADAADALDRALRVDPRNQYSYALLLFTNLAQGRLEEARIMRDFLKHSENLPLPIQVVLALFRQIAETPAACPISDELLLKIPYESEAERVAADIFAQRGEIRGALKFLESSVDKKLLNLGFIEHDPFLARLRDVPGFISLKERMREAIDRYSALS